MTRKNRTEGLHDPTPATHGDINIWGGRIQEILKTKANKKDIRRLEKRINGLATKEDLKQYATREDLKKFAKQITDHMDEHIDTYLENRAADLLGVKHDEVREIQRKVKNHEERITVLEI